MNKKIKALITVGGTGGHVFPGCNLALHLIQNNFEVKIVSDKRGHRFLKNHNNLNISILPSSPFFKKNLFQLLFSILINLYSILRSIIFLTLNRPNIVFGMGGYASFPICIAAAILKIKFILYENNLIVGKANKYLIPFAENILVSNKELEGIPKKYIGKIQVIGNIINKEIISFSKKKIIERNEKLNILVLGGSQAAKVFAEKLPIIFEKCSNSGISLKIFQHCLPNQNKQIEEFYNKTKINFEIFNFSTNLIEYFLKVDLAITRSGSSMLAELTNAKIPFISIPLPSSADNHQLKNANFYEKKKFSFLIKEFELNNKLFPLIKEIFENKGMLEKIVENLTKMSTTI